MSAISIGRWKATLLWRALPAPKRATGQCPRRNGRLRLLGFGAQCGRGVDARSAKACVGRHMRELRRTKRNGHSRGSASAGSYHRKVSHIAVRLARHALPAPLDQVCVVSCTVITAAMHSASSTLSYTRLPTLMITASDCCLGKPSETRLN